jgi:hypothetical protein
MIEQQAHDELQVYLIERADPRFTIQHVVDTWAAQHATPETKPIQLAFALVGLYLHVERSATGRYVQRVHMQLGRRKHEWPSFQLPQARGTLTVVDVMATEPGPERDQAIDDWCASVWQAYEASHRIVEELLIQHEIIPPGSTG